MDNKMNNRTWPLFVFLIVLSVFIGCKQEYYEKEGIRFGNYGKSLRRIPSEFSGEYSIPANVTSVTDDAFASCKNLTGIHVSSENTYFKSIDGVLFSADGQTLIRFPRGKLLAEYTIPNHVTIIATRAFESCDNLTSITIPKHVSIIEDAAFLHCENLTSITIPDSVTSIGWYAFGGCNRLNNIKCPEHMKDAIIIDPGLLPPKL